MECDIAKRFVEAKTILWVATLSIAASRHLGQADIQLLRE